MSVIESAYTPRLAINKSVGARTFGAESFHPTSGKIQGTTAHRYVEKQKRGRPLGRLAGAPPSLGNQVLDMFHTKHTTPLYNDGLGDEDDFNVPFVVNRAIKALAPCFGPIEKDQLCILYKNNEFNLNTCRVEGADFTLQCNPLDIISPQVFNYAIFQIQQQESERFPEIYRTRCPQDYFKDYSIDGVAETVLAQQNRASVFDTFGSRYEGTKIENPTACTSMATMIAKGVLNIINYWGSGIAPGTQLFFVIRKFASTDYTHDYRQGKLVLTNYTAKQKQSLVSTNDATISPFTPYQLAFFALPHGGSIPTEYTRYKDEEGNTRTDALVVRIGTVTEVPIGHVFSEMTTKLKPFTGSLPNCPLSSYSSISDNMINHSNMTQYNIKIILNPDDGLRFV